MPPSELSAPSPRPFLQALKPYVPGEQPREHGFTKLNTNEFPYPAAPEVIRAIQREASDNVRVYPDPTATSVRQVLAARHGVDPDCVIVGNGSDELLRLLAHAYLGEGRKLAMVRPTYTLYEVLAAQFDAQVETHPLIGGTDLPLSIFTSEWDACFLPVPNPPLGTVFPESALRRLAEIGRLLVLDGAYVDFAPDYHPDLLLNEFPNVALSFTFSKSFGLAGLRVGYVVGRRDLVQNLNKLRDSYNVNRISQAAALAALAGSIYYRARCNEIIVSREKLIKDLTKRGFSIPPSQGNFIFARHANARVIYSVLKSRKILVRHFNHSGLEKGIRITIGHPEENQILLDAIDKLNEEKII